MGAPGWDREGRAPGWGEGLGSVPAASFCRQPCRARAFVWPGSPAVPLTPVIYSWFSPHHPVGGVLEAAAVLSLLAALAASWEGEVRLGGGPWPPDEQTHCWRLGRSTAAAGGWASLGQGAPPAAAPAHLCSDEQPQCGLSGAMSLSLPLSPTPAPTQAGGQRNIHSRILADARGGP